MTFAGTSPSLEAEASASSAITVDPVTSAVGAVVAGIDMRRPLAPEDAVALRQAWLDHGVLFFRNQDVTLEQFWSFMANFGRPQKEEVSGTDRDEAKDVQTADMAPVRHSTAVWHADTTSLAHPPMATALRAVKVPPFGGDTCWSCMYAAYEALSEPMRSMLDGLTAVHSIEPTYDRMKDYARFFVDKYSERHAPKQVHPVVLSHPETGRKALYVSESFTTRIVELTEAESRSVLDLLFRHIGSPCFTMRWKWAANDIAFWDNRSVQHFAVPDYESTRTMQRIVLAGEHPSASARAERAVALRRTTPLGQLEQAHLGADDLLFLGHRVSFQNAEAGRSTTPTVPRPASAHASAL